MPVPKICKAALMAGALFASTTIGTVHGAEERVQRCLARFGADRLELEIRYRGDIITGRGLRVLDCQAGPVRGRGKAGDYESVDGFRPSGFATRLRKRVRLPFVRTWSRRVSQGAGLLQRTGLLNPTSLETRDEAEGFVAVFARWPDDEDVEDEGELREQDGKKVVLPHAFARRGDEFLAGIVTQDADNDGLPNVMDDRPFFFDRIRPDQKDDALDEAGDEVADEATREAVEDRVASTVEDRLAGTVEERAGGEVARGYRSLKPPVRSVKALGGKTGRNVWKHILSKPALLIPTAFVVYRGVDNYILDDGDTRVVRTGVLVR